MSADMTAARAYATDRARWSAVLRRDQQADGSFYYAVRTTGVFCRPSCPARRPLRRHVRFFPGSSEAAAAGFRPCRRCSPNGPSIRARHLHAIETACRTIRRADEPPTLAALAAAAGLSRHHFHRVFTSTMGVTPRAYAAAHRRTRVREALRTSPTITGAIYAGGYGSSGRFYATARQTLGMRPAAFRSGGEGVSMRVAVGQSALGAVLVAATGDGICAIALGDDPDRLLRDLQDRFPHASIVAGDRRFDRFVAAVVGIVQAPGLALDLPLDVRGTAFQQRVWRALCAIPAGTTTTYADLARRLRLPGGARAVARACAANPLAVAIPCHRVVRQDGDLAGYRWGIERKKALLEREREDAARRV